jgi:hypothetical protein
MTGRVISWLAAAIATTVVAAGSNRLYYRDDPIAIDPETEDASGVAPWNLNGPYDFIENSFFQDAEHKDVRAANVNTADEVPDSSWFTNRSGTGPFDPQEVASAGGITGPAAGTWTIVAPKPSGRSPGFVMRDTGGVVFFVKFDPPSNPEMASAAEIVSTRMLRAAGYHVPENSLALVRRDQIVIGEGVKVATDSGAVRPFTEEDVEAVLRRSAQRADGSYRALVSRQLPGTDLGPFRYAGTRPDDPNDLYLHEHRRELRGLRAFAAWLNHDDSRSLNTRDMLVVREGRRVVWHYLLDFGSTLGSGTTQSEDPRAGNEYLWESRPTILTVLTLGFYVRPWITVKYPDLPSVGRFEGDFFQPDAWKPNYPNPAFKNARADDYFWAARRLARFTDPVIAAAVKAAEYSDPAAERYVIQTLVQRRDKILARWLTGVVPLVDCAGASHVVTCTNVAVDAGVVTLPRKYRAQWLHLDNESSATRAVDDEVQVESPRFAVPPALRTAAYARIEIRADHPGSAAWSDPLVLDVRREGGGEWKVVGVRRM